MSDRKKVLLVGIDPSLIDFSSPEYAAFPGLTAEKVMAGLKESEEKLSELGLEVELCLTDFGETAEATVRDRLERKRYHCVLIGAGIRAIPRNLLLFERLINVVHACAPEAKICFNTMPSDSAEAVQRWL
ncbi:hypothetical protein LPW11_16785 [Geomonas sp. RF6]|uniref:hypothetical protein n=1 Tax=Geomonas sp. RF6 TaxID=2897342 RepID=UPI001E6277B3|nr:hypothetical protein [Geomonas sp. RF6]UFS69543.1 hypothetical protein LPW11_16785 [Geomonas sp. RF6]